MMTLDTALVIIMAEALAVLILLFAGLMFMSRKKRKQEMRAIDSFINKFNDQASFKNQPLSQLLSETCGLNDDAVEQTLKEVSDSERALMQIVIKLFLQREMSLLSQIEKRINSLSLPYFDLLTNLYSAKASQPSNSPQQGLERINQQLVQQLDTAMQTIDEITAEYTRVFSGNQTALELENSRKKMLKIFQDTEHSILHPSQDN